jgi:hypothetical protein
MKKSRKEWNPNPEVIDDIIKSYSHSSNPGRPTIPVQIAPGKYQKYSPIQIVQEVRMGTPAGREFYRQYLSYKKL